MIPYPRLTAGAPLRNRLEVFKGYNRSRRIGSGEFCEMENLTSDDYPVLSPRGKRSMQQFGHGDGYATGALHVPGTGTFIALNQQVDHADEEYGELNLLGLHGEESCIASSLLAGRKSFALMGKKLIVAPDMIAVDTDTHRWEKIRYALEISSGTVHFRLCREDGTFFSPMTASEVRPGDPADGDYWLEIQGGDGTLWQYAATQQGWSAVSSPCVKMWGEGIAGHSFQADDTVQISGIPAGGSEMFSKLNGSHVIRSCEQDSLVIDGIIPYAATVGCGSTNVIEIVRDVPRMDFILECCNRLWGCSRDTNEIYASSLGDCHNWNSFRGLSTDSWVGSVGTPGVFTGAAVQSGYPVFYKETCRHKVWPSATGAHQITTALCNGVEEGSEDSIAVLDGTVFYKSAFGVFADDGGGAAEIGQCLGDGKYTRAVGAVHDRKYYLSMQDREGHRQLFVYDIARRLWHRESAVAGVLVPAGESLYCVQAGELWDLTGKTGQLPEETVSWMAVTGDLGLELPEQKYISRLTLRLSLDPGSTLEVFAQYDREPQWVKLGQVYGTDLRSFSLPVRPRRCDRLRLKLQGTGMCKLYAITETLEKGSELA